MANSSDDLKRHEREARLQTLTTEDLAEWEIVIGCLLGERDAFQRLVTAYLDAVRAGALKAIRTCEGAVPCTADDLVQEFFKDVFTDAPAVLGNFDPLVGRLRPWLTAVAFRRCSNMLRSKAVRWPGRLARTEPTDLAAIADQHETPEHLIDKVLRILTELSERSQHVLKARLGMEPYTRRLSVAEIAAELNPTPRQVYEILARIVRTRIRRRHPPRKPHRRRDTAG